MGIVLSLCFLLISPLMLVVIGIIRQLQQMHEMRIKASIQNELFRQQTSYISPSTNKNS